MVSQVQRENAHPLQRFMQQDGGKKKQAKDFQILCSGLLTLNNNAQN